LDRAESVIERKDAVLYGGAFRSDRRGSRGKHKEKRSEP
jgi:hypothetical protein